MKAFVRRLAELNSNGLVAEYRLMHWNGQAAFNYAAPTFAGTLGTGSGASSDDPTWVGPAHQFDGVNDLINIGSRWMASTDNWTLEAKVRPSSLAQTGMIVYNGDDSTSTNSGIASAAGYGFGIASADGSTTGDYLVALFGGVAWVSSGYRFPNVTDFQHVVLTRRSGTLFFYVNSVEYTTGYTTAPAQPDNQARIGHQYNIAGRYFNGDIAHVIVRSVAVTAAQAAADSAYMTGGADSWRVLADQLIMPDAYAPMPTMVRTFTAVKPLPQHASAYGWALSRNDFIEGFLVQASQFTDMSHILAHVYPCLWDADTNTAWTGAQNLGTLAKSAKPGRSIITATGLPLAWATLIGTVGSPYYTQMIFEFTITNNTTAAHNVRFGLAGYSRCQADTTVTYDGTSVVFPAYQTVASQDILALKLLSHSPNTYAVGRASFSFASGAFDNTDSFAAVAATNYYAGVGTATLTIPAGGSVTITAAMSSDTTAAGARARLAAIQTTASAADIRAYWAERLRWMQAPPPNLTTPQRQAWYLAWYALEVCKSVDLTTAQYWASPTHYRSVWYWDACIGALAATLDANNFADKQTIEYFLDTRMNQSTGFINVYIGNGSYSQPPFIGRLAWEYYTRKGPGAAWLTTYYPKLKLHYEWWVENRKHATLNLFTVSQKFESGMDTNPIFDASIPAAIVQISSILYDYAIRMEQLAAIDTPADVSYWQAQSAAILSDAQNMWSSGDSWFYPLSTGTTQRAIKSLDAFFAIWSGLASPAQVDAMESVISSLFLGTYGVRSVANTEPTYAPSDYWRGPSWSNVNGLLAWGLLGYGKTSLANQVIALEVANAASLGTFVEMINPDTGLPGLGAGAGTGLLPSLHNAMHASAVIRAIAARYV